MDSVIQNRADVLRHMAVFVTVYPDECSTIVFGKSDHPVLNSLTNICQLTHVSYLFNHLKFVASLTKDEYERFPTGTTGNEAIHRKLNSAGRETTARYQDNLDMWLQIMRLRYKIYHDKDTTTRLHPLTVCFATSVLRNSSCKCCPVLTYSPIPSGMSILKDSWMRTSPLV